MEYYTLTQAIGLIVLVSSVLSLDAHSGTGSIVARDTDKVSALRNKLTKLSNLLSLLDVEDENDLQKVAEPKKPQPPVKMPLVSEDMGVENHSQETPAPNPQQKPVSSQQKSKPLVPSDSSIQILARALARLKEPNYNNGDSTGDFLGTKNNEPGPKDATKQEMGIIERALLRLDQYKTDNKDSKKAYGFRDPPPGKSYNNVPDARDFGKSEGGVSSDLSRTSEDQDIRVKEQALKVIESRLMHDILLANELDISVDDLIQDLDIKASKDAKMKNIEDELSTLNLQK